MEDHPSTAAGSTDPGGSTLPESDLVALAASPAPIDEQRAEVPSATLSPDAAGLGTAISVLTPVAAAMASNDDVSVDPAPDEAPRPPVPGHWIIREPSDPSYPAPHEQQVIGGLSGVRMVAASRRGKSHEYEGLYRDDYVALGQTSDWLIAVAADGAGSHPFSRVGARIATETAAEFLRLALSNAPSIAFRTEGVLRALGVLAILAGRAAIARHAAQEGRPLQDFATTLLGCAYSPTQLPSQALLFQVGDGALITGTPTSADLARPPDAGEFGGETVFITNDDWDLEAASSVVELGQDSLIVLATDGVSDDFAGPSRRATLVGQALLAIQDEDPPGALLRFLRYERLGSFDDRTIVVFGRGGLPA